MEWGREEVGRMEDVRRRDGEGKGKDVRGCERM